MAVERFAKSYVNLHIAVNDATHIKCACRRKHCRKIDIELCVHNERENAWQVEVEVAELVHIGIEQFAESVSYKLAEPVCKRAFFVGGVAFPVAAPVGVIAGIAVIGASIYAAMRKMTGNERAVKCNEIVIKGIDKWIEDGHSE